MCLQAIQFGQWLGFGCFTSMDWRCYQLSVLGAILNYYLHVLFIDILDLHIYCFVNRRQ
jgi:hypothetical protein